MKRDYQLNKEDVVIDEFLTDISNIFGFQAEEKNLRFEVNIAPNVPSKIHTDPKRLKQVLLNLLSNAFKFTQRGKIEINLNIKTDLLKKKQEYFTTQEKVDLSKSLIKGSLIDSQNVKETQPTFKWLDEGVYYTHENNLRRFLYIEVVDTGLGIEEKERRALFTKFGTGNNKGLNTNGLGLGLYLSKEICRKLGGDINCESILGIGSTFIIKLPFDEIYEIKELLNNDSKLIKSMTGLKRKNFDELCQTDFNEFFESESGNSTLHIIDKEYDLKVKNIFYSKATPKSIKVLPMQSNEESKDEKPISICSLDKSESKTKYEYEVSKTCNWKSVLIVDDLAFNLLAVELMLKKKFGIVPEKAFSGDEAIIKVRQKLLSPWCKSYTLILMDYYMPPGINGAEASLKIKQILNSFGANSYIAWLTSQTEGDFAFNKSLKNFDNFYSKPIDPEEIKHLMKKLFPTSDKI